MFIAPVYAVLCYTVVKHGRFVKPAGKKNNTINLRDLRRILKTALQQKMTNEKVLRCNSFTSIFLTLISENFAGSVMF